MQPNAINLENYVMPKTDAERKAAERARKKVSGLVRWIWDEWVTPKEAKRLDKLREAYLEGKHE